jgi:hypothetical protein
MKIPLGGEFMRLVRGNFNKLGGGVISFSRMRDKELIKTGAPRVIAAYATNNLEKYIERVADSKEGADYIRAMARDINIQVKERCGERGMTKIYSSRLTLNDETKLYEGKEDIIYAGEYSNPFCCLKSVNFGTQLYFFRYDEQNLNPARAKSGVEAIKMTPLKEEILKNFIFPLINSYKHNDLASARTIRESVIETYGNSSMANPLVDILRILDKQKTKPDMKIIHLDLDEAQAINDERFEEAAKIRDEIRKIRRI